MKGTVKWYNDTKGFGFIKVDDDSKDIFVHRSGLKDSFRGLEEDQEVEFDIEEGKKGPLAINVTVL